MNANAAGIKEDILSDMRWIKATLNANAELLRNYKGVGCEYCAGSLESVAARYDSYIATVNGIN